MYEPPGGDGIDNDDELEDNDNNDELLEPNDSDYDCEPVAEKKNEKKQKSEPNNSDSDYEPDYEPVIKKKTPRKKSQPNESDSDYEPPVLKRMRMRKSPRGKKAAETIVKEEASEDVLEQSMYMGTDDGDKPVSYLCMFT